MFCFLPFGRGTKCPRQATVTPARALKNVKQKVFFICFKNKLYLCIVVYPKPRRVSGWATVDYKKDVELNVLFAAYRISQVRLSCCMVKQ
jgi:hypothetical protein